MHRGLSLTARSCALDPHDSQSNYSLNVSVPDVSTDEESDDPCVVDRERSAAGEETASLRVVVQ